MTVTVTQHWAVIGGVEKGGIVVREGQLLSSPAVDDRLGHGAIIKEVEFDEKTGRLRYELAEGAGPQSGWVSIKMQGKDLLIKSQPPAPEEQPPEGMSPVQFRIHRRCKNEVLKQVPAWKTITVETVTENHMKKAKGMLYGLDFPWTEAQLHSAEFGAAWLTKAFHVAGTLSKDNKVTKLIAEKELKITTGNNGGKFLFKVEYLKPSDDLHTQLFAKIPHSMEGDTRSDRLSSSVNKQPMELHEINASRLLESELPVQIPRFYFGDISNETSNFIIITEQVKFHKHSEALDFAGVTRCEKKELLEPFQIEGPYDKCMDWTLLGDARDYYFALVKCGARMAGCAKAGKFGDPAVVALHFLNMENMPISHWGMQPGCSGQPPKQLKVKLDMALALFSDTGKAIFPAFCSEQAFQSKFRSTLMLLNAYFAELNYWMNSDSDYVGLTHNNLNVDNAYFWRDQEGNLDLGVFDWGGMGSTCLGSKLWWWLYCADYETTTANMDGYLDCFVDNYADAGGPRIDKEVLRLQFVQAALSQMLGLSAAVPQIYKMCPKAAWPTIKDRYDPRIGENIHGKSTLRLYLHVMNSIVQIVQEWKADEMMLNWESNFVSKAGTSKKDKSTMEA